MPRNVNRPIAAGIRGQYERHGSEGYYRRFGRDYRNPHEPIVRESILSALARWRPDLSRVLDLAAGSGEATLALSEAGAGRVDGVDPYTFEAYSRRTGRVAERMTFDQIAAGAGGPEIQPDRVQLRAAPVPVLAPAGPGLPVGVDFTRPARPHAAQTPGDPLGLGMATGRGVPFRTRSDPDVPLDADSRTFVTDPVIRLSCGKML